MLNRAFVPAIQVREQGVVLYSYPCPPFNHARASLEAKTYTGKMSPGAVKRIRTAVDVLLQKSPVKEMRNPITLKWLRFRLTFVTLTISSTALIPHRIAYKQGLEPFLRWFRRKGCRDYVWKAELQERGQIHYHITANQFVRYDEVRSEWNRLQASAGWLVEFQERFKHSNPNSTDIRAVRESSEIGGYLAKYMSKGEERGAIDGKAWGCSQSLAGVRFFSVDRDDTETNTVERLVEQGLAKSVELEQCVWVRCPQPMEVLTDMHQEQYRQWLDGL
jgi:hypothetical protein